MGMDFWGQVWKRVWEMAFFGLKLGLDLEIWAAHPHQKFQEVPPLRDGLWAHGENRNFIAEISDHVLIPPGKPGSGSMIGIEDQG